MTERRKAMLLVLTVPWVALAVMMASLHLHGPLLKGLAAAFALGMTILLMYVVAQMMKSKRSRR